MSEISVISTRDNFVSFELKHWIFLLKFDMGLRSLLIELRGRRSSTDCIGWNSAPRVEDSVCSIVI